MVSANRPITRVFIIHTISYVLMRYQYHCLYYSLVRKTKHRARHMAQILLVDDSISMREMVSFTLKEAGHDVIEAEDGIQALDVVQDNAFNLVITDVNMPKMDGIILTSKLRQLDSYRFTPILILTTETSDARKQDGKVAGATGWIEKPFDPDSLLSTVNRVL